MRDGEVNTYFSAPWVAFAIFIVAFCLYRTREAFFIRGDPDYWDWVALISGVTSLYWLPEFILRRTLLTGEGITVLWQLCAGTRVLWRRVGKRLAWAQVERLAVEGRGSSRRRKTSAITFAFIGSREGRHIHIRIVPAYKYRKEALLFALERVPEHVVSEEVRALAAKYREELGK